MMWTNSWRDNRSEFGKWCESARVGKIETPPQHTEDEMRETLQPIAKILEEAGQFEPGGMVMREWVGVSGSSAACEAFVQLLEKSPAGLECALDFVLDTKRHWFRRHKL